MRFIFFHIALLCLSLSSYAHEPGENESPFRFIENKNQWDDRVKYLADIPSGVLFLEKNCFTYHLIDGQSTNSLHPHKFKNIDTLKLRGQVFRVNFENSNSDVVVNAEDAFEDYYNYFLGNDPNKWASKVNAYKIVNYLNMYDGIDLKVYSKNQQLKYDLIILPNADPAQIKLSYEGLDKIFLYEGSLILKTSLGNVVEQKPYAYQVINGREVAVPCNYVLQDKQLTYAFPKGYDKRYKLIIDPTLIFSTYSGSFTDNFGYTATFDSYGFLYSGSSIFGSRWGYKYPTTVGAYETNFQGGTAYYELGTDIGITKYDTSGTKRIYSTYLGGSKDELPHSLIVDNNDDLLILGTTSSDNYPTTSGAYDNSFGSGDSVITLEGIGVRYTPGTDIVITKLSNDGSSLLASTFLGGSSNDGILGLSSIDHINITVIGGFVYRDTVYKASNLRYNYADEVRGEIEIDKNNNIYIASCTKSSDFPIVGSPFQGTFTGGTFEAVVVKMDNNLSNIIWSTFLGGDKDDAAYSLEIDSINNVYVSGGTTSSNFPSTSGVLYPNQNGGQADGFISCISADGSTLLYSSYYGTFAYDQVYFVDLDNRNNVYVFGQTSFTGAVNPFIHNAIFNQPNSGQFISKMTPELDSLIWSTTFGDGSGRPNISPTAFLVDLCNKIYLSGWGGTPENNEFISDVTRPYNMLTTLGLNPPTDFYQPNSTGKDFYLFVLEDDASAVHYASYFGGQYSDEHVDGGTSRFDKKGKIYQAMCAGCYRNSPPFGPHSDMPIKPPFGGGTELPAPNNSNNCNIGVFKMDFRLPIVVADFDAPPACPGEPVQFTNKSLVKSATNFEWDFGDGNTAGNIPNPTHSYAVGGTYYVRLVVKDLATCNLFDTIIKPIYISSINSLGISATADQYTVYKGKSTTLHAIPNSGYLYSWTPAGSLNHSNIPNPVATPDTTTTYTVTISDPLVPHCNVNANVRISVIEIHCDEPDIFIPDAFTPNGDNKNDVLYVRGKYIKDMFFTVYDRWGEKIFETRDQNVGWDGTYKGMKADPAVFVYYLEVTCVDDQKFFKKGNVTLIR